ncbi:MAG: PfkB family carbohydrate kinase [Oscillospiraceae bacterium]|nr:PfkB family carbohydrate kinase [Oscillospiraceae bacterium]
MIYTLTMNPAFDYILELDELVVGGLNRAKSFRMVEAGKGYNVALALDSLDVLNIELRAAHAEPRINVKIHAGGSVTEVNTTTTISEDELALTREPLRELEGGDILVASGSLPKGVPTNFYAEIAEELSARGVIVIVDTSGEPLRAVARSGAAFMIAPNEQEFAELSSPGGECDCNVLLSMGEKGAKFIGVDGQEYFCPVEKAAENGYTVGAGDTLLAGFVAEWSKSKDFQKALNAGVKLAGDYVCK